MKPKPNFILSNTNESLDSYNFKGRGNFQKLIAFLEVKMHVANEAI